MDFNKLEKIAMFKIDEADKKSILDMIDSIKKVAEIDTTGIEPTSYPFKNQENNLRDDNDTYTSNKKDILANAKNDGTYVVIEKAVK